MLEMQPIAYMSSGAGSSFAADFCATSRMLFPASMAISIALMDFGRPTKSGMTMWGKTTTSRSGRSGNWTGILVSSVVAVMGSLIGETSYRESGGGPPGFKAPAPARRRRCDELQGSMRPGNLGLIRVNEQRLAVAHDRRLVDDDLAHVLKRRKLEHDVEQDMLEDRPQSPGAGLACERPVRDRGKRLRPHLEIHALHPEQLVVLLGERVLRLGEDPDERVLVQLLERGDDRQPADEFGDQAVLDQILGLDVLQRLADGLRVVQAPHLRAETDAGLFRPAPDDLLEPVERTAADEQNVRRIDLDEVLVRVLAAALWRYRRDRPLDELQQRLLHALAGDVARDRRVVALARDLVDLVDIDDAALRLVDVVVAVLQQLLDDVLDVLADVTGLGERGRIGDDERHVEQPRERLREQRLARPGRPDQQDVRFRELDLVVLREVLEPLVEVLDRHREDLLRLLLADHVLVQDLADLLRGGQIRLGGPTALVGRALLADDVVTELDALVADEHRRPSDQLPELVLALTAERAVKELLAPALVGHACHRGPSAHRRFVARRQDPIQETILHRLVSR